MYPAIHRNEKKRSFTSFEIEIAVSIDQLDEAINAISSSASSGKIGDGKIFVSSLDQVIRIRTGETGQDAI